MCWGGLYVYVCYVCLVFVSERREREEIMRNNDWAFFLDTNR